MRNLNKQFLDDTVSGRKPVDTKTRFLEKVRVQQDGCWIWTAFKMKNGYGLFRMPDKHYLAHRISFNLFNGALDAALDVMHMCDEPACVNPKHLVLGTRKDNMQDAKKKHRTAFGERHGRAKLTESQAKAIKVASGYQKDIAKQFGVSQVTVHEIKVGRKWGHI